MNKYTVIMWDSAINESFSVQVYETDEESAVQAAYDNTEETCAPMGLCQGHVEYMQIIPEIINEGSIQ